MLSDAELADCRATQAEAMSDECTIRRPGGVKGEFDPVTGTYPVIPYDPHYEGACRAQADSTAARDVLVADQQATVRLYAVVIPYTVTGAQVDDIVTVTVSRDDALVDRELVVRDVESSSFATARRMTCVDNLG